MIRELKLYDICGEATTEVIKLNNFFDALFCDMLIYKKGTDLIFIKNGDYIMEQDSTLGYLWCRFDGFWSVLKNDFKLEKEEIQQVILYKVMSIISIDMKLTTQIVRTEYSNKVEEFLKDFGSLTPYILMHDLSGSTC